MSILDYFGGGCLALTFIGLVIYSIKILRVKYQEDIQIVWYFFSLTLVISHLIALWATNQGAIDNVGAFQGEAGQFINNLITAVLDINLSFIIIFSILALILLPQFISYILSGCFGVAAAPVLLNESFSFVMWGIVKTFIVASGVTTTIFIFGTVLSWDSFEFNKVIGWILLSMSLCCFAFFSLLIFRVPKEVLGDVRDKTPNCLVNKFVFINNWLIRHLNKKEIQE